MARTPGQLVFPANIERNIAAPLDATMKVIGVSSLIHPDTFRAVNDDINYSYIGMITVVTGDSSENNGLYILNGFPTTEINNWQKLQFASDSGLDTDNKNIIDAINELNKKIINSGTVDVEEINTQLKILIDKVGDLGDQLNDIQDGIEVVDTNVKDNTKNISKITNDLGDLGGRLDDVESRLDGINTVVKTEVLAGGEGTLLKFNETDNFLQLEENAITEYTISLTISGKAEKCFIKKLIEFSANTLSNDNIIITHAMITDEDALNANLINAIVDLEQNGDLPQVTIKLLTDVDCNVYIQTNMLISVSNN